MAATHRPKHKAANFANSQSVPHGTSRPLAYRVGFLGVAVGVTASATPPDALPLAPAPRPGPATPGVAWRFFPSEFGPGRGRASGSWYPPPFSSSTTEAPPKLSPAPVLPLEVRSMPRIVQTVVYELPELSQSARERARAWYRDTCLDWDWYDAVFEDFQTVCGLLGVTLRTRTIRLMGGGTRKPTRFGSGTDRGRSRSRTRRRVRFRTAGRVRRTGAVAVRGRCRAGTRPFGSSGSSGGFGASAGSGTPRRCG